MNTKFYNQPLLFTAGVHGNEQAPVIVVRSKLPGKLYLICHPQALLKNARFVESDLNRSFPGSQNGTIEEKIAYKLVATLKKYQSVIDLHTATCVTPPFAIITKVTSAHLRLANRTGINKIVLMSREFGAGKSLIDFVSVGISIESGCEKSLKTKKIIEQIITQTFKNSISKKEPSIFQVFRTLAKTNSRECLTSKVSPFKLVTAGTRITNFGRKAETDFYPVLARSKNYPNFLCLMAKKVNLSDFNVTI